MPALVLVLCCTSTFPADVQTSTFWWTWGSWHGWLWCFFMLSVIDDQVIFRDVPQCNCSPPRLQKLSFAAISISVCWGCDKECSEGACEAQTTPPVQAAFLQHILTSLQAALTSSKVTRSVCQTHRITGGKRKGDSVSRHCFRPATAARVWEKLHLKS